MFRITVADRFAAAHQLRGYKGQCERLHGHNWQVEVTVEGEELSGNGILLDFSLLKKALSGVLKGLDHSFLNELSYFQERNPTSEHLAYLIFCEMRQALRAYPGVRVREVTVWESDRARATYLE